MSVNAIEQERTTNEILNTRLYEKMFAEQEDYREWVLQQSPKEILDTLSYEYRAREDLLLSLEYNDLSNSQARALLKLPNVLSVLFDKFEHTETDYMERVWAMVEEVADELPLEHDGDLLPEERD